MGVNVVVFQVRGGQILDELEPSKLSWQVQSNTPETVDATFQLSQSKDFRNLLTEWKHGLAVDVGGGRLYGGPIMPHDFSNDGGTVAVQSRGLRVALGRRSVLPVAALGEDLAPNGVPDPAFDTVLSGLDHGSIGRAIGVQACEWPGWDDIPIEWGDARAGSRSETYKAVERKPVDEAWSDLSGQEKGPDIRLQLTRDGSDAVKWLYESGTEEQPRLEGSTVLPVEPSAGAGLTVQTDPSRMGSLFWGEGGRSSDEVLIRSLYDPFLVDAGYPLLEIDSGASVTTSDPSTLDRWNVEASRTARRPWEFWSFKIRADRSPFPREYNCGSLVDVYVTASTPVSGGYIPARHEPYRRRIVGMSGDVSDEWITITCGEVYDG